MASENNGFGGSGFRVPRFRGSEVQGSAFMVEGLASPAAGGIREPRV